MCVIILPNCMSLLQCVRIEACTGYGLVLLPMQWLSKRKKNKEKSMRTWSSSSQVRLTYSDCISNEYKFHIPDMASTCVFASGRHPLQDIQHLRYDAVGIVFRVVVDCVPLPLPVCLQQPSPPLASASTQRLVLCARALFHASRLFSWMERERGTILRTRSRAHATASLPALMNAFWGPRKSS